MTARSIILRDPEVRALLAGRVTARREIKPRVDWTIDEIDDGSAWPITRAYVGEDGGCDPIPCPFGAPGSVLRVRECFAPFADPSVLGSDEYAPTRGEDICDYRADSPHGFGVDEDGEPIPGPRWRSAASMPSWASRLSARVASVRVERADGVWMWCVELKREVM